MSDIRATSGVKGLDALLQGGYPPRRSVLLNGAVGTGKTTMALQFLMDGVQRGEPGLLVAVDQKPRHIVEDAKAYGWDLQEATTRKMFAILDASPYFTAARGKRAPLDARQVASDLTQQARALSATRLAIDSLTSLVPDETSPTQVRDFLRSLFFSLEDNIGCTVLLTSLEGGAAPAMSTAYAEFLASGVVDLKLAREGDRYRRTLFVRKMRGTTTDMIERPFQIVKGGLALDGHA